MVLALPARAPIRCAFSYDKSFNYEPRAFARPARWSRSTACADVGDREAAPPTPAAGPRMPCGRRRRPALEALWSAQARLGARAPVAVLGALVVLRARAPDAIPNYDTYYTLVWGQEIFHGHLPDYDVLRPPTPHPLATFVGWLLAPFGTSSDRLLVLCRCCCSSRCSWSSFRFTQRLLGTPVALLAVVVMLTRTDIDLLALRAMFDLPFYVLVFGAAALELRRPELRLARARAARRSPGCCGPRRGCSAGVYWLWLIPVTPRPQLIRLAALVAVAPVLWLLADLIVDGPAAVLADRDARRRRASSAASGGWGRRSG